LRSLLAIAGWDGMKHPISAGRRLLPTGSFLHRVKLNVPILRGEKTRNLGADRFQPAGHFRFGDILRLHCLGDWRDPD